MWCGSVDATIGTSGSTENGKAAISPDRQINTSQWFEQVLRIPGRHLGSGPNSERVGEKRPHGRPRQGLPQEDERADRILSDKSGQSELYLGLVYFCCATLMEVKSRNEEY